MEWSGIQGLGFGTGIGAGNMKQNKYRNMKHMEERDQEQGYERINRNDKAGDNGPNRARPEDHRRLHAGSKAQQELGR